MRNESSAASTNLPHHCRLVHWASLRDRPQHASPSIVNHEWTMTVTSRHGLTLCVHIVEATELVQCQFISVGIFQKLTYNHNTQFAMCSVCHSVVNDWFCIALFCMIDCNLCLHGKNKSSWKWTFLELLFLRNECSWNTHFSGRKVSGNESSTLWNFCTREQKGLRIKGFIHGWFSWSCGTVQLWLASYLNVYKGIKSNHKTKMLIFSHFTSSGFVKKVIGLQKHCLNR